MKPFHQGVYQVQNTDKYVGKKLPTFRSSWERRFCHMCDTHPNVIKWASEIVRIPYRHPEDLRLHEYVPDFLIQYIKEDGKTHTELVEIKPSSQTTLESARTVAQKRQVIINSAKWAAASAWCEQRGIRFRVLNEQQIFQNVTKAKPKRQNKPRQPKRKS